MTWPVERGLNADDEQEEEDPNVMQCYRKYKLALMKEGVFDTIQAMVMKSVRIPERDKSIVDHTTIRLALYLFRNLSAIPDLNMPQFGSIDQLRMANMQEALMIRYYKSDVIEFLMTLASNSTAEASISEVNLLVLESLYNFFSGIDPKNVHSHNISNALVSTI